MKLLQGNMNVPVNQIIDKIVSLGKRENLRLALIPLSNSLFVLPAQVPANLLDKGARGMESNSTDLMTVFIFKLKNLQNYENFKSKRTDPNYWW